MTASRGESDTRTLLSGSQSTPAQWSSLDFDETCSLHGVAPYIGRLKESIARSLVLEFSRPDDVIADPFCGSGTIPLEALLQGRRGVGADCNDYALLLARAKL